MTGNARPLSAGDYIQRNTAGTVKSEPFVLARVYKGRGRRMQGDGACDAGDRERLERKSNAVACVVQNAAKGV